MLWLLLLLPVLSMLLMFLFELVKLKLFFEVLVAAAFPLCPKKKLVVDGGGVIGASMF